MAWCVSVVGLLATGTIGCGGDKKPSTPTSPTPPASPSVNRTFTLSPGQTVSVPDTTLTLTFEQVTKDQRCPAAALCVADAKGLVAVVALTARMNGQSAPLTLETDGDKKVVTVNGFRITLEGLSPYPISSFDEIAPMAYRADVRVAN
jgi:hypothetical protein